MLMIIKPLFALACFATAASAAVLHTRSSRLTFNVINNCTEGFAPVFLPALPGMDEWSVIEPGKSAVHHFRSDTYVGKVFAPVGAVNVTTGQGATQGEIDLDSGDYDISVADGFNVPMYLSLVGQQRDGYCQPAHCANAECHDAYKSSSGTLTSSRIGASTSKPNHSCSPAYTQWILQFC